LLPVPVLAIAMVKLVFNLRQANLCRWIAATF
jgi:hypothetical protein